ncbi:hypothetical protein OHU45_17755 [Streptomyces tubercidicus]|uniref:hypothetical protein n=1 Tax=Streptomyces tubercidicus TaxID=47759 RepID=UPI0032520917
MDEGVAAVIAGGFGLVGAMVGGAAAAWGSKIGAEKTAAATRRQVEDQAHASHKQWLRQQRLEAVTSFMTAWDLNVTAFGRLAMVINNDNATSTELAEALRECRRSRREIEPTHHRVSLLYNTSEPTEGILRNLSEALSAARSCHKFWPESREDYQQAFARSFHRALLNYNSFARTSSTVLVAYDLSEMAPLAPGDQ